MHTVHIARRGFAPFFAWAIALLLGLSLFNQASAQGRAAELTVSVIHATKASGKVDPALAPLAESLKKAFASYQGFRQLSTADLKLTSSNAQVSLPNGQTATFRYLGPDKRGDHRLNLAIPQSKVDMDLRVPAGKVFYQAGMRHLDGILILALTLRP